ncbi:MAG: NAD-dependent protein deacetylase [Pararobbsia sp.]
MPADFPLDSALESVAPATADADADAVAVAVAALAAFLRAHPRVFVLGGAGVSTASGIPDYRDAAGQRKGRDPVMLQDFLKSDATRRRYWARNMIGWPTVSRARPNAAHRALVELGALGHLEQLVTQNVDGLHSEAGSADVIELHGNIGHVVCLDCGHRHGRAALQDRLEADNPAWLDARATPLPDGDAQFESARFETFRCPSASAAAACSSRMSCSSAKACPRARVEAASAALARADGMLVIGSSLMVYSGFRFCEQAARAGIPIAAVNLGRTRADALFSLKVMEPCGAALSALVERLARPA